MFKKIGEVIGAFRKREPRLRLCIKTSTGIVLVDLDVQTVLDSFGGEWKTYFGPGPYWEVKIWRE